MKSQPQSSDVCQIAQEIERISGLDLAGVRTLWRSTFKKELPSTLTRDLLVHQLAWHIQEKAFGGHDAATLRLLDAYGRQGADSQLNPNAVALAEKMAKEAEAPSAGAQSVTLDQLAAQAAVGTKQTTTESVAPGGDPYFAGQKALAEGEYERSKALLIERVARDEFASRCGVIPKIEVDTISISGMNSISRADLSAGMSDYHPDLIKSLRAVALQVAKDVDQNPSRCDYWRQNPEAVAQMRQEADLSRY